MNGRGTICGLNFKRNFIVEKKERKEVKKMINASEKRDEKKDKSMHEKMDTKQMKQMKKKLAKRK